MAPFLLKSLRTKRLHNTCNPAADAFQAVKRTALQHMMLLNMWVHYTATVYYADSTNGIRLCAFRQQFCVCQGAVCSSIMMYSMFSLARATWRGALAMSDMSHKNCDPMESSWDLYPMIWRTQKRRQRCRRRLLKSAPSQCEPEGFQPNFVCIHLPFSLHQLCEQALVIVMQPRYHVLM